MPRDNICMYMMHVYFYVCCSDCVGICGNVCCVAAVVKNCVLSLGVLKYVVCLCKGCDGCCVFCCIVRHRAVGASVWEVYACVLCPVEVLNATFCMTCSLLMVEDERCDHMEEAPSGIAYKRWSCHCNYKLSCKLCRNLPPPVMGARFTILGAIRSCGLTGWPRLLLIKASDVETNPGPSTTHKQVWICVICNKQNTW